MADDEGARAPASSRTRSAGWATWAFPTSAEPRTAWPTWWPTTSSGSRTTRCCPRSSPAACAGPCPRRRPPDPSRSTRSSRTTRAHRAEHHPLAAPGLHGVLLLDRVGPGILGEWLAAGLNSNVMLWRNAPASTEVERWSSRGSARPWGCRTTSTGCSRTRPRSPRSRRSSPRGRPCPGSTRATGGSPGGRTSAGSASTPRPRRTRRWRRRRS